MTSDKLAVDNNKSSVSENMTTYQVTFDDPKSRKDTLSKLLRLRSDRQNYEDSQHQGDGFYELTLEQRGPSTVTLTPVEAENISQATLTANNEPHSIATVDQGSGHVRLLELDDKSGIDTPLGASKLVTEISTGPEDIGAVNTANDTGKYETSRNLAEDTPKMVRDCENYLKITVPFYPSSKGTKRSEVRFDGVRILPDQSERYLRGEPEVDDWLNCPSFQLQTEMDLRVKGSDVTGGRLEKVELDTLELRSRKEGFYLQLLNEGKIVETVREVCDVEGHTKIFSGESDGAGGRSSEPNFDNRT